MSRVLEILIGLAIGVILYSIPYAVARFVDPYAIDHFDYVASYIVWLPGVFLGSLALARRFPGVRFLPALSTIVDSWPGWCWEYSSTSGSSRRTK